MTHAEAVRQAADIARAGDLATGLERVEVICAVARLHAYARAFAELLDAEGRACTLEPLGGDRGKA